MKANLGRVPRGAREAELPDWTAPEAGRTVRVALDPARPPRATMEKLFRRAAKLERGETRIDEEAERCRRRFARLTRLAESLAAGPPEGADAAQWLETASGKARALRVLLAEGERTAMAKTRPENRQEELRAALLRGVRSFQSRDGWTLYVGKSAADNDALTFRLARGRDWWFHLAPAAGSHVVAVAPAGSESLPQETLLDAATLAVYYSKMRGASRADVTCARVSDVRKRKGAPPGQVLVQRSRTVPVRIEAERLDRLVRSGRLLGGDETET